MNAEPAEHADNGFLWKALTMAAAFAAAFLVEKLVSAAWKAAVGHAPPSEDLDAQGPPVEVAVAAALTGAAAALARHYAVRGTQRMALRAANRAQ